MEAEKDEKIRSENSKNCNNRSISDHICYIAEMGFIKPAVTLLLHTNEVVPVMILGFRMFFRLPADAGSNSENVKTNV